jgi:hypothetical protein
MTAFPSQVRISAARQGGYSTVVAPSPLNMPPLKGWIQYWNGTTILCGPSPNTASLWPSTSANRLVGRDVGPSGYQTASAGIAAAPSAPSGRRFRITSGISNPTTQWSFGLWARLRAISDNPFWDGLNDTMGVNFGPHTIDGGAGGRDGTFTLRLGYYKISMSAKGVTGSSRLTASGDTSFAFYSMACDGSNFYACRNGEYLTGTGPITVDSSYASSEITLFYSRQSSTTTDYVGIYDQAQFVADRCIWVPPFTPPAAPFINPSGG